MDNPSRQYDGIILGAGLAGLYSAYLLSQSSPSICLLEARTRVGGRVSTWRGAQHGQYAELGPEFIDSNHSRLIRLAKQFNLKLTTRQSFWGESPQPSVQPETRRAWRTFWRQVNAIAERIPKPVEPETIPAELRSYDTRNLQEWLTDLGIWHQAYPLLVRYTRNMEATEPERLSVLSIAAQEAFYGKGVEAGIYHLPQGTDRLPRALAKAVEKQGGTLQLGAVVESVHQNATGVQVYYRQDGQLKMVSARYAVVALPFPVIPTIEWRPNLSPQRMDALQLAGKGQVVRTLIQFRTRFWLTQRPKPVAQPLEVSTIWEETDDQPGETGILSFWVAGANAERWAGLSEDARIANCLQALEALYPGCREQVLSARSHHWGCDPFSRHAYIYHSPNYLTQALPRLRRPEGRLVFAGDYLSLFVGYMEGALESAERAVNWVKTLSTS
ncbi:MAG: NAD(P)/FAD-dependent oxidoreductase [Fimbriimonadales bacterium]